MTADDPAGMPDLPAVASIPAGGRLDPDHVPGPRGDELLAARLDDRCYPGTVGDLVQPQRHAVRVVVVRTVVDGTHRDDRAGPHKQRDAAEAVLLGDPARAGDLLSGQESGPGAVRHVVRHLAVG